MARIINLVYPFKKQYENTMQKIKANTSKDGKVIAEHGGAEHNTFKIRDSLPKGAGYAFEFSTETKPKMFAGAGWKYSLTLAASFALFGFIVFVVRIIIG